MQHMTTNTFRGFNLYSLKNPTINVHTFCCEILNFFKDHKCISNFLKYITIEVFTEHSCLLNCNQVILINSTAPCNFLACVPMTSENHTCMGIHPQDNNTSFTSFSCFFSKLKKSKHLSHGTRTTVQSPSNTLVRLHTQN